MHVLDSEAVTLDSNFEGVGNFFKNILNQQKTSNFFTCFVPFVWMSVLFLL